MAHTLTTQDGQRRDFEHLGDFLGALIRRTQDVRVPVIIEADPDGMHVTELVTVEMQPAAPLGAAGAVLLGMH